MNLVKRILQTATVAVAFVAATAVMTGDAAAQHCTGGIGHGLVHGGHHGGSLHVIGGGLHGGFHGGFHGGCHSTLYPPYWHDTSHWDCHGPRYVWHGDHWDLIPGHCHWHETGHWHGGGGGIIHPY